MFVSVWSPDCSFGACHYESSLVKMRSLRICVAWCCHGLPTETCADHRDFQCTRLRMVAQYSLTNNRDVHLA